VYEAICVPPVAPRKGHGVKRKMAKRKKRAHVGNAGGERLVIRLLPWRRAALQLAGVLLALGCSVHVGKPAEPPPAPTARPWRAPKPKPPEPEAQPERLDLVPEWYLLEPKTQPCQLEVRTRGDRTTVQRVGDCDEDEP
jgi:hypothetical protein